MQHLTEDGFTLLLAAIVNQSVEDYQLGFHRQGRPSAQAFLEAAGLLIDGQLDRRFTRLATRTGRKRAA